MSFTEGPARCRTSYRLLACRLFTGLAALLYGGLASAAARPGTLGIHPVIWMLSANIGNRGGA